MLLRIIMEEIIVEPHIRIGQLKLGMTSDELENALLQMKKQRSNSSDEAMQMERCAETDDPNLITGRYMDNDSFFLVQYRNEKLLKSASSVICLKWHQ